MFIDDAHIQSTLATDEDLLLRIRSQRNRRGKTLIRVAVDLTRLATQLGQTGTQAREKVEALFRTFVKEVYLYEILGTDDLAVAIAADTTLAWLNVDVSGLTIRQRLVNRLT